MNPTAPSPATSIVRTETETETDAVVVALATDPGRPPVEFAATIRHPARFAATFGAFLRLVAAGSHHRPGEAIVTVADDAWIAEGFAADQAVYAQLSVDRDEFAAINDVSAGTTGVSVSETLADLLGSLGTGISGRLRLAAPDRAAPFDRPSRPAGWLRGFAGVQAALSLPTRRIAVDRGGLFGLISALGESRRVRTSRSVLVRWAPGRGAEAVVRSGACPVPLHARAVTEGPGGSVRVAVGSALLGLTRLLPRVDGADLFLLGPGLPSFWSVQLGGSRLLLGIPGATPDGRLGSLHLDAVEPPVEPGRFLANQVVATFRTHPSQTRAQVVERTRGAAPEVAAVLARLASLGQILAEPATGLFRWRPAFDDATSVLDDPEPAEVSAARAISRTTSIQVGRAEVGRGDQGRRITGLILDRPVSLVLDPDGWMSRGHCTCSHHQAGGLTRQGPCRHLLALQAQVSLPAGPRPPDVATWFAGWPAPMGLG